MAHSLAGMLSTPDSSALAQTAPALAGSALAPTEATAMPSQTVLPMRQI
jgi:hypothetical protein